MPKRSVGASFKAGRTIILEGVTYAVDAVVPNAVVGRVTRLSALLSNRMLVPNVDHYGKALGTTGKVQSQPLAYSPVERAGIV